MRASAIELILDVTTTALIGFAMAAPFGVLAGAMGSWIVAPEAAARVTVTWGSVGLMMFMLGSMAAVAAWLAKGVTRRGPVSIVRTALSCLLVAASLAPPALGYKPTPTTPDAAALLPVVLLVVAAGLLFVSAWQLKLARAEGAR